MINLAYLFTNAKLRERDESPTQPSRKNTALEACLYLRVSSLSAPETKEALEIVRFSPGEIPVLFYDASTGKTVAPKNTKTNPTSLMLGALRALLGEANVVLRV